MKHGLDLHQRALGDEPSEITTPLPCLFYERYGIWTHNLRLKRPTLYQIELNVRILKFYNIKAFLSLKDTYAATN